MVKKINFYLKDYLTDKTLEFNDEFQPSSFEEMKSPDKWVHEHGNILGVGRILHTKTATEELITEDKYIPRNSPISADDRIIIYYFNSLRRK